MHTLDPTEKQQLGTFPFPAMRVGTKVNQAWQVGEFYRNLAFRFPANK